VLLLFVWFAVFFSTVTAETTTAPESAGECLRFDLYFSYNIAIFRGISGLGGNSIFVSKT